MAVAAQLAGRALFRPAAFDCLPARQSMGRCSPGGATWSVEIGGPSLLRGPPPSRRKRGVAQASLAQPLSPGGGSRFHEYAKKLGGDSRPPLSDMVWTAAGAFAAMAGFSYMDSLLAPRGLTMTLGSFGAIIVLLFTAPRAPASQKWNVIVGHLGCALISVLALSFFGPGWATRAAALAVCIAYMQFTGSVHPPAAGLPLIFIDAPKFHVLKWWYIVFPGLAGCFYLFFLQEMVQFLKENFKF